MKRKMIRLMALVLSCMMLIPPHTVAAAEMISEETPVTEVMSEDIAVVAETEMSSTEIKETAETEMMSTEIKETTETEMMLTELAETTEKDLDEIETLTETENVNEKTADSGQLSDTIYWKYNNGVLTISGKGKLELPDDPYYVDPWVEESVETLIIEEGITAIGESRFNFYDNLTEVYLPESLTELDRYALGCNFKLTKLHIGNKLSKAYSGFYGTTIKEVYLNQNFNDIDYLYYNFYNWDLEKYVIDERNPYYASINGVIVSVDKKTIIKVPNTIGAEYEIPSSVTCIAEDAFRCTNIEKIVIPDTVTEISRGAFGFCEKLKSISFPDTIKVIPEGICHGCSELETVVLSEGVEKIDENAFCCCPKLKNVTIPKSVTSIIQAFLSTTELTILNKNLIALKGTNIYGIFAKVETTVYENYQQAFEVLEIVNKERKKAGLEPLKMDQSLLETAMLRAAETTYYFSHTRPSGVSWSTANDLMRGENIASGAEDAVGVMNSWMNSPGHRGNILNDYKTIGIGCVSIPGQGLYWVQCFGDDLTQEVNASQYTNRKKTHDVYMPMLAEPALPNLFVEAEGIGIAWDAGQWADMDMFPDYRIYRKVNDGEWKELDCTFWNSYLDTDIVSGNKYSYTIQYLAPNSLTPVSSYNKTGRTISNISTPSLKSVTCTTDGLNVSWSKVDSAEKYYVYLKTSNGWKKIAETKETSYKYTKVSSGSKYTFTVQAEKDGTLSGYSLNGISGYYLACPNIKTPVCQNGSLKINWDKIAGAEKYYVYLKTSSGWKYLAQTTTNSYTYKDVKSGTKYEFTVRAVKGSSKGSYSSSGVSGYYLSRPALKTPVCQNDSLKVNWDKVTGAEKYNIYLKTSSGWKYLAQTTTNSYTYKDVKSGTKYTFTVRAVKGSSMGSYASDGVSNYYLACPVLKVPACQNGSLKISWNKVTGAEKYQIYLKTSSGWKRIAETQSNTYTYKSVSSGKKYTFTVRAVKGSTTGKYSSTGTSSYYLSRPTLSKISRTSTGKIKVTWKAVSGAEKYLVYRKESGGSWKKIAETKNRSYSDSSSLKKGKRYYYTVRAAKNTTLSAYNSKGLSIIKK